MATSAEQRFQLQQLQKIGKVASVQTSKKRSRVELEESKTKKQKISGNMLEDDKNGSESGGGSESSSDADDAPMIM